MHTFTCNCRGRLLHYCTKAGLGQNPSLPLSTEPKCQIKKVKMMNTLSPREQTDLILLFFCTLAPIKCSDSGEARCFNIPQIKCMKKDIWPIPMHTNSWRGLFFFNCEKVKDSDLVWVMFNTTEREWKVVAIWKDRAVLGSVINE